MHGILLGNAICSEEGEVKVIGAAKAWIGTSTIIIISAVAITAVAVFLVLKKKK
ncbi:MAG: hypothetical protein ACTSYM_02240 [Candidatus Baldrarchaeia archaeon]